MSNYLIKKSAVELEQEWKEHWAEYIKIYPETDGADYADEREAFYEGKEAIL